jgi:hypothetical protein
MAPGSATTENFYAWSLVYFVMSSTVQITSHLMTGWLAKYYLKDEEKCGQGLIWVAIQPLYLRDLVKTTDGLLAAQVCNLRPLHHEVVSSGPRLGLFPSNVRILLSSCTDLVAKIMQKTKIPNSTFTKLALNVTKARFKIEKKKTVMFASTCVYLCSAGFLPCSIQRKSVSWRHKLSKDWVLKFLTRGIKLVTYIREVRGSNLGWNTLGFSWFSTAPPDDCHITSNWVETASFNADLNPLSINIQ